MLRAVTLPPGLDDEAALAFALEARRAGADLLELRSDLHRRPLPVEALAELIPLLASQRTEALPRGWDEWATLVDRPLPAPADHRTICSHHAATPLTPDAAVALWARADHRRALGIKHVEPLGKLCDAGRLFETQRRLEALVGPSRVTVLATGPLALPFRAALAESNALDYLAASPRWASAEGQRLLADAVRSDKAKGHGARLGILGSAIAHARSPRIHPQPFDRLELPPDAPLAELLPALWPHYRGLAVTSPFKKAAAEAIGDLQSAVNTLVRGPAGFWGLNTDVEGAREVLAALGSTHVTVLGDGGATVALRRAASAMGVVLRVLTRARANGRVDGPTVWTWPASVAPPLSFSLRGATVAVIAYGPPGRRVAEAVRTLGGTPRLLGPRWFVAQARAQRAAWKQALVLRPGHADGAAGAQPLATPGPEHA